MEPVDRLYPVNEHSACYLEDAQGYPLPVTPQNVWAAVQANPDRPDS